MCEILHNCVMYSICGIIVCFSASVSRSQNEVTEYTANVAVYSDIEFKIVVSFMYFYFYLYSV